MPLTTTEWMNIFFWLLWRDLVAWKTTFTWRHSFVVLSDHHPLVLSGGCMHLYWLWFSYSCRPRFQDYCRGWGDSIHRSLYTGSLNPWSWLHFISRGRAATPPTILSKEALKMELDVTLFQRLKTRGARYLLIDYITSFVIDLLLSALWDMLLRIYRVKILKRNCEWWYKKVRTLFFEDVQNAYIYIHVVSISCRWQFAIVFQSREYLLRALWYWAAYISNACFFKYLRSSSNFHWYNFPTCAKLLRWTKHSEAMRVSLYMPMKLNNIATLLSCLTKHGYWDLHNFWFVFVLNPC